MAASALSRRLSEVVGVGLFALALIWLIALASYSASDPVWFFNTGPDLPPANFAGRIGAFIGELSFQLLGYAAYLIPVVMVVGALVARRDGVAGSGGQRPKVWKLVPWFLIGFVALAAVNSVWPLPSVVRVPGAELAGLLITWALAAIGLSTDLSALRRTGLKPVLLGGMLWMVVAGTSLAVQFLTTASLQV